MQEIIDILQTKIADHKAQIALLEKAIAELQGGVPGTTSPEAQSDTGGDTPPTPPTVG